MVVQIVSILAASITVTGFVIFLFRKAMKIVRGLSERIDKLETALKISQKFEFVTTIDVAISNSNQIITVEEKTEFVLVEIVSPGWVKGKIYHNQVEVIVPLTALLMK